MKHVRTEILRFTATQEMQLALGPLGDLERSAKGCRRVQLLVPDSPRVHFALDLPQVDLLTSKLYRFPVCYPGAAVEFPLGAEQTLALACDVGYAVVTIIVEHYTEG